MAIIGTAGWSIPRTVAQHFPAEGAALARYASVFNGVEINSTFYRRHKPITFARWADSVPASFRFAVKFPKQITHVLKLKAAEDASRLFLQDIAPLGEKLGPILCQLPPSLVFDPATAGAYLAFMRSVHSGEIVVEPRHTSWVTEEAVALLSRLAIVQVFADPSPIAASEARTQRYMRLHGKPKVYYSSYGDAELRAFETMLSTDSWCIFDNTASGAAIDNALTMREFLQNPAEPPRLSGTIRQ
jgi:uncharacterized protein YecE (DUF72 family)